MVILPIISFLPFLELRIPFFSVKTFIISFFSLLYLSPICTYHHFQALTLLALHFSFSSPPSVSFSSSWSQEATSFQLSINDHHHFHLLSSVEGPSTSALLFLFKLSIICIASSLSAQDHRLHHHFYHFLLRKLLHFSVCLYWFLVQHFLAGVVLPLA